LTIAWGKLDIEIWTHKVNSITENDFVLASKIENIK
jgi:4a-hydroxytetrahydrobiopterin dehydratase